MGTGLANTRSSRASAPVVLLTLGLSALSPAKACGPDFPLQLLSDRGQHLQTLPEPTFALAVLPLASVTAQWPKPDKVFSSQYDWQQERLISATEQAEQQLLPPQQAELVKQMRAQADADAALKLGANLPAELRLYTAGAVALARAPQQAAALFEQLLALPAAEQQQRRSWALYSLARLHASQGKPDQAIMLFQQLRAEVSKGLNDPLQLAVASLGEEARLYLQQQDWQQAIGLYASQAQQEESGRASLKQLAGQLLQMPDAELQPLLSQPNVSRLLSIYLLTQLESLSYSAPEQLSRLLQLLQQTPALQLPNALELAAISYQQGQYQNAELLLNQASDAPLKWWLTAKLALRNQQLEQAAAAYAKASKAFPTALPPPAKAAEFQYDEPFPAKLARQQLQTQCRVQAEAGVLELQRGEYLQAMRLLYQAGAEYWQDAAYVAERVLTSSELRQFVEQEVPAGQPKAASEWSWFGDTEPNTLIRQLLARRLMREGDVIGAQRYFIEPKLQQLAARYQQLQQDSQAGPLQAWLEPLARRLQLDVGQLARADALFALAKLTREHGLELLGFEMAPDYQVFYGQFEYLVDPDRPALWPVPAAEQSRITQNTAQYNKQYSKQYRGLSGAAVPEKRFHYRYLAAELAAQSAELWPHNSKAYAASLCAATTWLINRDPQQARQYYRHYLQTGPYVSWGADFGIRCPQPDRAAAAQRLQANFSAALPSPRRSAAAIAGLLLLSAAVIWWRRRRRSGTIR